MHEITFTERVRTIPALAREEAVRRRHPSVDTGHLLLGMIAAGLGVGVAVLKQLGTDMIDVQARVDAHLAPGTTILPEGVDMPYTEMAKKTLDRAITVARDLNHAYVGSEHLMLALLHTDSGIAFQVLTEMGVTFDVARDAMLQLLGMEPLGAQPFDAPVQESPHDATG